MVEDTEGVKEGEGTGYLMIVLFLYIHARVLGKTNMH